MVSLDNHRMINWPNGISASIANLISFFKNIKKSYIIRVFENFAEIQTKFFNHSLENNLLLISNYLTLIIELIKLIRKFSFV